MIASSVSSVFFLIYFLFFEVTVIFLSTRLAIFLLPVLSLALREVFHVCNPKSMSCSLKQPEPGPSIFAFISVFHTTQRYLYFNIVSVLLFWLLINRPSVSLCLTEPGCGMGVPYGFPSSCAKETSNSEWFTLTGFRSLSPTLFFLSRASPPLTFFASVSVLLTL